MTKSRSHIWFVSPAILLMIVILILPVFVAATFSFTDYNLGVRILDGLDGRIMSPWKILKLQRCLQYL